MTRSCSIGLPAWSACRPPGGTTTKPDGLRACGSSVAPNTAPAPSSTKCSRGTGGSGSRNRHPAAMWQIAKGSTRTDRLDRSSSRTIAASYPVWTIGHPFETHPNRRFGTIFLPRRPNQRAPGRRQQ